MNDDARILVVDDEEWFRKETAKFLVNRGFGKDNVGIARDGEEALAFLGSQGPFDVMLMDVKMPNMDGYQLLEKVVESFPSTGVFVVTGVPSYADAVAMVKRGAEDYIDKPEQASIQQLWGRLGEKIQQYLQKRRPGLPQDPAAFPSGLGLIGQSASMQRVRAQVDKIIAAYKADGRPLVFLYGPEGTGKRNLTEAIARMAGVEFARVSCADFKDSVTAQHYFLGCAGKHDGDCPGTESCFEHEGLLLIDDIQDLLSRAQSILLDPVETEPARRVYTKGMAQRSEDKNRPVRCQIIVAATNKKLPGQGGEGFRSDLLGRLKQFYIYLPPLSKRQEDIPLLADHFAKPKTLTNEARALLSRIQYPHNVRGLYNLVNRARTEGSAPVITETEIRSALQVSENDGDDDDEEQERHPRTDGIPAESGTGENRSPLFATAHPWLKPDARCDYTHAQVTLMAIEYLFSDTVCANIYFGDRRWKARARWKKKGENVAKTIRDALITSDFSIEAAAHQLGVPFPAAATLHNALQDWVFFKNVFGAKKSGKLVTVPMFGALMKTNQRDAVIQFLQAVGGDFTADLVATLGSISPEASNCAGGD